MRSIRDHFKKIPGLVRLVRAGRKLCRHWRTMYLRSRYPDGGYLKCGNIEVFCDFTDPTYAWYDGLPTNLAIDQQAIEAVLQQSVGRGNVLVDIGAHNGFFTAYLARVAQVCRIPNAKVIGLEPDRQHFRCLQKTADRCSGIGITLIQMALADSDGSLSLYRTRDSCLHTYATEDAEPVYAVEAISLDSLAAGHLAPDDRIAFIKIDIDGAEPVLFSGGQKTLDAHRPTILMEFAPTQLRRAGVDPKCFYSQLCDNFEVYWASYKMRTIRKVQQSDYKDIETTVGDAISDLMLSTFALDFSNVQFGRRLK